MLSAKIVYVYCFYLNLIFHKIHDGCQDGDHVWWRHRPPAATTNKIYLILLREDQGLSTEGKIVSKYCNVSKIQGGGGGCSINPPPLYHGGGMTLRVCPRVNASFHCSEKVIIFNEWKSRSLRWNRRSLLRIMTYCSISVTTIITCTAGSKTMERCIKSGNALAL